MTKKQQLEALAKELFPDSCIHYGRSEMCCEIPNEGVPWGYTMYPGTGWQKDIKYLGKSFVEAKDSLERISIDMSIGIND